MRVCFVMGYAGINGGSNVIFQHALHMSEHGVDVTIVVLEPLPEHSRKWHPALERLRFIDIETAERESYDLVMATWWKTAFEISRITARQYAYFVQMIESWIYPESDVATRNLANSTYLLPMPGITEATWIQRHLAERFGRSYQLVHNGIQKELFTQEGPAIAPRVPGRLRVLVEGPLAVDHKNVARTIRALRNTDADEIWLLTQSSASHYPGVARVFSRLPITEVAKIYRSCDAIVKLSLLEGMFGPPLEMFHCGGTAVVYDVMGHDEYIENGRNALVVKTGDEAGVIAAVNRLKHEEGLYASLCAEARKTAAAWPGWPAASARFKSAVETLMSMPPAPRAEIAHLSHEFRQQHERVSAALAASAPRASLKRLGLKSAIGQISRLPQIERFVLPWRSRLVEERRVPVLPPKI